MSSHKFLPGKNHTPSPQQLAMLQAQMTQAQQRPQKTIEQMEQAQPKLKRQIHPRFDLVLLERLPSYEGSLVMPDSVEDSSQYFKVVEVGPGRVNERGHLMKSSLEPGDICFATLGGSGLFHQPNGQKVWLVQDQSIIATFSKASTDEISEAFENGLDTVNSKSEDHE